MAIKLFGRRLLVKYVPPQKKVGRIYLPDITEKHDTHRMGTVEVVSADCKFVKLGDTVVFQVNDVMSWAQIYKQLANGEPMLHLLETEVLARVHGDTITPETFEILGDYVLVTAKVIRPDTNIILPSNAAITPDMLHYTLEQIGQTVDLPIKVGQEIIINHGRVSRMYLVRKRIAGGDENTEFGYTAKEWVHGVIEADESATAQ